MKRDKYNLEVGTKIEWVVGCSGGCGRISKCLHGVYEVATDKITYFVHPRQITKVWRKKEKKQPQEIWVNFYSWKNDVFYSKDRAEQMSNLTTLETAVRFVRAKEGQK